ncbi:Uncharacterised protein [Mycobacteroides abscessus subsp. abscessus]|nr:Uncharacterised protein [Mycobacteroides abscessus subsp. abscessus]
MPRLRAPSQPITAAAVSLCVSVSVVYSTTAESPWSAASITSHPRRRSMSGSAWARSSSIASSSGWSNMLACGKPWGPSIESRANSASTVWL